MENRLRVSVHLVLVLPVLMFLSGNVAAASWNGIEPLKSRRADVERILGKPASEAPDGTLHFTVAGGSAIVSFVNERLVDAKKLRRDLVGTVLEIVLQHDSSSDTPDSLNLTKNRDFNRENVQHASVFRNLKDGILYTFLDGKLRTTRYSFSAEQLGYARRSG